MNIRPILAITLGDPCGIGPEITTKALARPGLYERCRPLVIGSALILQKALKITQLPLRLHVVEKPEEACYLPGVIDVLHQNAIDIDAFTWGKVSIQGGAAAFRAVKTAIDLALLGYADATITNPLNKEALNLAGHHYSGHTEIYAELTGTRTYCMMLAEGNLRTVHVSTHVSLREACDRCKKDRILHVIRLAHDGLKAVGIPNARIAVAGLNPHAGENGLFGREEIEEITPAIQQALAEGMHVEGPLPPDSVFAKARGGLYDVVVAQYHDQGHIPLKTIGFQYDAETGKWGSVAGVNITLGLPIIRASVDHGTAFDQAGKGTANEESLINAIDYGIRLAQGRNENPMS